MFSVYASFNESKFNGYADFSKSKFIRGYYAEFIGSKFSDDADFSGADFGDNAHFNGSKFSGDANFNDSKFGGDANFNDSKFSKQLFLSGAKFEQFHIRWGSIKEHLKYDGATYLILIQNFKDLGLFEDADQCYYEYKKLSQKNKN